MYVAWIVCHMPCLLLNCTRMIGGLESDSCCCCSDKAAERASSNWMPPARLSSTDITEAAL